MDVARQFPHRADQRRAGGRTVTAIAPRDKERVDLDGQGAELIGPRTHNCCALGINEPEQQCSTCTSSGPKERNQLELWPPSSASGLPSLSAVSPLVPDFFLAGEASWPRLWSIIHHALKWPKLVTIRCVLCIVVAATWYLRFDLRAEEGSRLPQVPVPRRRSRQPARSQQRAAHGPPPLACSPPLQPWYQAQLVCRCRLCLLLVFVHNFAIFAVDLCAVGLDRHTHTIRGLAAFPLPGYCLLLSLSLICGCC